ncbi:hypothetical protein E2C01_011405 [Portunus trituberculatus]|uniref:Uncharacterized protein n=1 Tax=Portunus trituberculatus TaxID=210409 RepID=A0A5B7DBB0_PORTR|nr:hypothetical protein [Portunus trituberculatus]
MAWRCSGVAVEQRRPSSALAHYPKLIIATSHTWRRVELTRTAHAMPARGSQPPRRPPSIPDTLIADSLRLPGAPKGVAGTAGSVRGITATPRATITFASGSEAVVARGERRSSRRVQPVLPADVTLTGAERRSDQYTYEARSDVDARNLH